MADMRRNPFKRTHYNFRAAVWGNVCRGKLRRNHGLPVVGIYEPSSGIGMVGFHDDICRSLRSTVLDFHVGVVLRPDLRFLVRRAAVFMPAVPDCRAAPIGLLLLILPVACILNIHVHIWRGALVVDEGRQPLWLVA